MVVPGLVTAVSIIMARPKRSMLPRAPPRPMMRYWVRSCMAIKLSKARVGVRSREEIGDWSRFFNEEKERAEEEDEKEGAEVEAEKTTEPGEVALDFIEDEALGIRGLGGSLFDFLAGGEVL